MRLLKALFALLAVLLALPAHAAPLRVVTTVPDLAALAQEVGGERVRVTALALPTQDPHFVDARPSLALELSRADLLIAVGLDLEVGWLPVLQPASRNPRIQVGAPGYLVASDHVELLGVPTGPIDRAMGDIHPGGNPHFLVDPRRAAVVAEAIAERLTALDPAGHEVYRDNLDDFLAELDGARERWQRLLAPLRGMPVIGYHDSWAYLGDWLGFERVAHIEPRPGIAPNPQHVARVLQVARARNVRIILQEAYYPDATARTIAERSDATLVRVSGGADLRRDQTYIERMEALVDDLARAVAEGA